MTRETKIRYIYKHNGKIAVNHFLIWELENGVFKSMGIKEEDIISRDLYTGFINQDGQEVYEGDILYYKDSRPEYSLEYYEEVFWNNLEYRWSLASVYASSWKEGRDFPLTRTEKEKCSGSTDLVGWQQIYQSKVIGNIWENPELLKGNLKDGKSIKEIK